jgi:hypothetical protein
MKAVAKRKSGFYWARMKLVRHPIIAFWTDRWWIVGSGIWVDDSQITRILSDRLEPPKRRK